MNTRERTRFIFVVLLLVLSFMILVGYGPREAELQVAGGDVYKRQELGWRFMKTLVILRLVRCVIAVLCNIKFHQD